MENNNMEIEHSSSWSPTLSGLLDELKAAIMVLLDAKSAYKLSLTCKNFLKIIKDPQLRMHKRLFKLVTDALTLEDHPTAFKIVNSCLILFPWYWKLWRKRSDYWNYNHEFTKVIQDLRKAYEVCPREAYRHLIMSDIYVTVTEVQSALAEIQQAINLRPDHLTYYHQRAYINSRLGMTTADQESDYLMILEKGYKRESMIHNNLAYCYFLLERDDEAAEHYSKALELMPSFVRAMLNKALLHLYRNELDQTLIYCEKIRKINPEIYEIYRDSAEVFFMQSKYKKATRYIQKSWHLSDRLDLHGTKIYFILLDRLGVIDRLVEEVDGAITHYESLLAQVAAEMATINDDLIMKAAVKKQNSINGLLYYSLKRKIQSLVFLGEFEKAVNLYEQAKVYATSGEEDKFFDLLFNQKVVNFNNVKISKQLITKMSRTSMLLSSERKKFIAQVNARVHTMDEVMFFTLCLLKKTTVVNLFQFELTNLSQNDENNLKMYWAKAQSYCKNGVDLKLIAIERMGWEHL